jgi:hypothetical protein
MTRDRTYQVVLAAVRHYAGGDDFAAYDAVQDSHAILHRRHAPSTGPRPDGLAGRRRPPRARARAPRRRADDLFAAIDTGTSHDAAGAIDLRPLVDGLPRPSAQR